MNLEIFETPSCDADASGMRTIAEWKALLASSQDGDAYSLTDPGGAAHRFTFEQWGNRDPKTTLVGIRFRRYNPSRYGTGRARELPAKGAYEL